GTACQHSGRYLDGAHAFERAAALGPHLPEIPFHAGECYAAATFFDSAAAAFERALALDPRRPETHFRLGQAYWRSRRLEEARREVAEAVRLRPESAEYCRTLGLIEADLPDTDANRRAALEHLTRSLRLDSRSGTAHYRLGTLYRRLGRWHEAV